MREEVTKKISRAEKAGRQLGENILEMMNLMYQKNTAKNFHRGLISTIVDMDTINPQSEAEEYRLMQDRINRLISANLKLLKRLKRRRSQND